METINVVGLGYIGLPTALMFAAGGQRVVGTDISVPLVEKLNEDGVDFKEEQYEQILQKAKSNGIIFTNEYAKAPIYIIAVSTPYLKTSKKVDVSYIMAALEQVLAVCEQDSIVVIESTVSPGTIEKHVRPRVCKYMEESKKRLHLAHAPERIIPGNMFYELVHNARVIGVDDREIGERLQSLYASFCKADIVITDIKTAEMSKVVENTYRDINIAFANELTKICREGDMDVYEVIKVANMHPRVNILRPGPGVGGHCISVDPWFLVGDYPGLANIILAARKINDSMPEYVLTRIHDIMAENNLKDFSRVGFYGLTYKENVDDLRESPTIQLMERMSLHLAQPPKVYDPMITEKKFKNQYLDFEEFTAKLDLLVIMIGHDHIKLEKSQLIGKIILDTQNILPENKSVKKYYL